jgi:Trypsin-like peptidase domain
VRLILYLALVCAPIAAGRAEEGFFTDRRPPAVRAVWPSVFALQCESRKGVYTATAFLVAKIDKDRPGSRRRKLVDYYFVTAGHAIGECRRTRQHLVENLGQRRFEDDGITVARRPQRLQGVTVVRVDEAYDIAVVKVTASAGARVGTPIEVDGRCDPDVGEVLYSVGFPGVDQRRSLHLKREEKRWSKGKIVGLGKAEFHGHNEIYIASTVDSLPGSSGGPAVNEAGRLIGVVAKGAATDENGFRYDVDPKEPRDWQTFLAPCTAVLELLRDSRLE